MDALFTQIEAARATIAGRTTITPQIGLILGSGLGGLADELEQATVIAYDEIPGFARSTVHGHRGELAIGQLAGRPVVVLRGRFHFYEGYTMQQVTFPVRVMRALGCDTLIVTNAAGGLRADWAVGDLMQIADQIFFPGMAGPRRPPPTTTAWACASRPWSMHSTRSWPRWRIRWPASRAPGCMLAATLC